MPTVQEELTKSLSILLDRDVAEMSDDDLLDLIVPRLRYYSEQRRFRNNEEAELTESVTAEIIELLKVRIKGLRVIQQELTE